MLKDVLEKENVRSGALWRRLSPLIYPAYGLLAVAYVAMQVGREGWAAILPSAFVLLPVVMWLPVHLRVDADRFWGKTPEYAVMRYLGVMIIITKSCFGLYDKGLAMGAFADAGWLAMGLVCLFLTWGLRPADRPGTDI